MYALALGTPSRHEAAVSMYLSLMSVPEQRCVLNVGCLMDTRYSKRQDSAGKLPYAHDVTSLPLQRTRRAYLDGHISSIVITLCRHTRDVEHRPRTEDSEPLAQTWRCVQKRRNRQKRRRRGAVALGTCGISSSTARTTVCFTTGVYRRVNSHDALLNAE